MKDCDNSDLLLWYDIATGMRTDVRKARKRRIAYAYNNTRRKHGNNENSLSRLRRKSRKDRTSARQQGGGTYLQMQKMRFALGSEK